MLYIQRPNTSKSAFALKWSDDGVNFTLIGAVLIDIRQGTAMADYRLAPRTPFPLDVSGNETLLIEADAGLASATTTAAVEAWLSGQGITSPDAHNIFGDASEWESGETYPTFIMGPGPVEIGRRTNGTFSDIGRGVRSMVVDRNAQQERDGYYGFWSPDWPIEIDGGDAVRVRAATDVGNTPNDLEAYLDQRSDIENRVYVLETHS